MRRLYLIASLILLLGSTKAFAQNDKEMDLTSAINQMLEQLEKPLALEDWQIFTMDSTLTYNYTKLNEEVMELRRTGVYNSEIYMRTSDKWTGATDSTFQKHILTPEQWTKYLKTDYGREKRARDKREALRVSKGTAR